MCFDVQVVWQPYLEEGDEGQPWLVQARPYFGRSVWIARATSEHGGVSQSRPDPEAQSEFSGTPRHHRLARASEGADPELGALRQVFALKYGAKVYKGAQRQVDVARETASLRALLYSAMQDREIAQREAEQLRKELERVRRVAGAEASSSRVAEGSQSNLEDRLAAAVRRAEEAQTELAERVDAATGERDRLCIRAEAAELLVAETTRELATLQV
ncbi:hypothetical protein Taro_015570 [Colocasia esculenta]|uniref:Uncharacterized protein n=1 Tax=Colocasia esculenta TaxID=4460 RepID=A0A843UMK1_COLES|nr:hypothetical protein [Colocasia esculenta]